MPIYEYECEDLHRFEKWQSMKDDALTECPECGKPVRKIFHPAGIIFKGSGWYITDSRKPAGDSKSDSKSETKTDSSSETKTENKDSKSSPESPKTE